MKKVIEIIKNNKRTAIILGSIFLVVVAGLIIRNTLSDPNTGYLRNQTVEGLSMEDASLEYKDGVSTFTANVFNESGDVFNLKTIEVILESKSKTTTLTGYIGETLEKEEGRVLRISIDQDLSDSEKLTYKINK
mgnify:FL=1